MSPTRVAVPIILLCLLGCAATPAASPTPPVPAPSPANEAAPHEHHHGAAPFTLAGLARDASRLPDLGNHRRPVTTRSPEAQAYFDQGLALTYGFNHDEAARSFAKAGEIDPGCAICFWGAAYVLGPNYNIPMLPDRAEAAWDALSRARAAASTASPVEQALIEALGKRYKGPEYLEPPAMQPFVEAFATAMGEVAARFPDDLDVQVLHAEAMMNRNPWRLWSSDGRPAPGTEQIVSTLERVLAKSPDHPGANHYYIHAIEASKTPDRAVAAADRLGGLIPGAGHTVHMPAHIYQRVGRYADASEANRRAVEIDLRHLATVRPAGYYPFYLGHNYGFLAYSAAMEGRSAEALEASKKSTEHVPKDIVCGMPGMDFFLSEPLLVMVRFGRFGEIAAQPKPDPKYQVLTGLWHHAQGMAMASTGNLEGARAQSQAIAKIAAELPPELVAGLNAGRALLELAGKIVDARIAEKGGAAASIALWEQAVALEDALAYSEPADWFYPVRHYLGAALLDAGRAKDAVAVYRADLARNPKNGWAAFGLWKALEASKQVKAAKAAKKDFEAWFSRSDVQLQRSAF